jgi:hypothetical protein
VRKSIGARGDGHSGPLEEAGYTSAIVTAEPEPKMLQSGGVHIHPHMTDVTQPSVRAQQHPGLDLTKQSFIWRPGALTEGGEETSDTLGTGPRQPAKTSGEPSGRLRKHAGQARERMTSRRLPSPIDARDLYSRLYMSPVRQRPVRRK